MSARFLIILGFVMAPVYIGAGIFLWVSDWFKSSLEPAIRIIFSILFILYGVFRLYRNLTYLKNEKSK